MVRFLLELFYSLLIDFLTSGKLKIINVKATYIIITIADIIIITIILIIMFVTVILNKRAIYVYIYFYILCNTDNSVRIVIKENIIM